MAADQVTFAFDVRLAKFLLETLEPLVEQGKMEEGDLVKIVQRAIRHLGARGHTI